MGCAAQTLKEFASSNEWRALLHINENNVSEILDNNFFISGQMDPEIELKTLLENMSCDNICKYPARYRYLSKKMNLNISFSHCNNLQKYLEDSRGDSVSIVFASSYLESPTSYFGHTFIKINKKKDLFFSQTLSYAAELPESVGLFNLVNKGINGGFSGKYVASPYFKLIEEYSIIEQRKLYEYELNLTQDEIEDLLWHSYETLDIAVPYKFFSENCAYEVFWFLENAKPNLKMRQKLKPYVVPYETIEILLAEGLVEQKTIRHPSINELSALYFSFSFAEKNIFEKFANSDDKQLFLKNADLSIDVKNKFIELISGHYDILFKKFRTVKSDYSEVKNLEYTRSRYINDQEFKYKNTHSIFIGKVFGPSTNDSMIRLRPALFNRYEPQNNILSEQTFELMQIEVLKNKSKIKMNSFDIIKLESLNKRFVFYDPWSWRLYLGGNRSLVGNKFSTVGELGVGITKGNEYGSIYGIGQMALYPFDNSIVVQGLFGLSYWIGQSHINYDFKSLVFTTNDKSQDESLVSFNYEINKKVAFSLSKDFKKNERKAMLIFKF